MDDYDVIFLTLVLIGLTVIGKWSIYEKAMQPGWASLIPVYSTYVMFRICWNTYVFWVYLAASILTSMLSNIYSPGAVILGLIGAITNRIINYYLTRRLAKAFGRGVRFTIGLFIIPSIFLLILGFGSSEYDSSYEMSGI